MDISINGCCDIVMEFFEFAINSILYQREMYDSSNFSPVKKYNLILQVCHTPEIKEYLDQVMIQIKSKNRLI
jgi:mitotic spindle assembly checkpoint protein MAD2